MAEAQPITLITGASAGIGAALADEFARHGHGLVLVARREPQLAAVAAAVEARGHLRPRVILADLAQPGAADRIDAELRAANLEVQFLVNNAGFGLVGPATSLPRSEQLAIVDLNAHALTELSIHFIDSMARHKGGILNVASLAGFMPGPGMAVYHATKAYALSFSEALHQELKARGVRVTALCPGPVETEFRARAGMPSDYFPPMFARSAERVAREGYAGLMANRRVVVPGSHNRVAAWLPRLLPRGWMLSIMSRYRRGRAP
jgi:uncharacterized protein